MQVREFIHESLYSPSIGYFSRPQSPVGQVDPPIDFGALWGQEGYRFKLNQLYTEQKVRQVAEAPIIAAPQSHAARLLLPCPPTYHRTAN